MEACYAAISDEDLDLSMLSCTNANKEVCAGDASSLLESLRQRLARADQIATENRSLRTQVKNVRNKLQEVARQASRQIKLHKNMQEQACAESRKIKMAQCTAQEKVEELRAKHAKKMVELRGQLAHAKEQIRQLQEELHVRQLTPNKVVMSCCLFLSTKTLLLHEREKKDSKRPL